MSKNVVCEYCKKSYVSNKTLKIHQEKCVKKILHDDEVADEAREKKMKMEYETKIASEEKTIHDKDELIQDLKDRIEVLLARNQFLEGLCTSIVEQIQKTL